MVQRVDKASTGNSAGVSKEALEGLCAQLDKDDVSRLEPEYQDLIKAGLQRLDQQDRARLFIRLAEFVAAKQAKDDHNRSLWAKLRSQFESLFGAVQTFVRAEKRPTRFTTPPLGQGERLDLWQRRMSRVVQSWRRGKRVDVTERLTDDGAFTLYFDDFGDFETPITFAVRATKGGAIFSVDFQPGQGEVERVLGDSAREQLRLFFHAVLQNDRGHEKAFKRFVRRMNRGVVRAPTVH
jgi:hypothetical protein